MRKKKTDPEEGVPATQAGSPSRLTPLEVQQKEFRLSFRGYNEREVDAFLDRMTEDLGAILEENKRLKEIADAAGPEVADAALQAEQILEQARVQAAGIIRGAETRTSGGPEPVSVTPADAAAISAFLSKERQFLQSMAGLIQGHAESVKRDAKTVMTTQSRLVPAPAPAASATPSAPPASKQPVPAPPARTPEPVQTQAMEPIRIPDEPSASRDPEPVSPRPPVERPAPEHQVRPTSPEPQEPAPAGQPQQGASVGATPVSTPSEEDPSLRELFWGEE